MATLSAYSVFKNDLTGEVARVSTHKWPGMHLRGFRFCTDKEVKAFHEAGGATDVEKVLVEKFSEPAKKKVAKKKVAKKKVAKKK